MILIIALAQVSFCDQEAGNSIYVTGNGARYAKCIPSEEYGTNGVTQIFLARENEDILEYSYNWYSPREVMFHRWLWGLSVVRFGPGPRGEKACKEDLVLAFYDGEKLMASYSTLDIAGNPTNVQQFVSHYTVIQKVHGYRQWKRVSPHIASFST